MLEELRSSEKVIGVKQSRRAVRDGLAQEVFLACDADPALTEPLEAQCQVAGIAVSTEFTMKELGHAAGIHVGAAVVTLLKKN